MTLRMALRQRATKFTRRNLMNPETQDEDVLRFAAQNNYVLITCNRDDFLEAAREIPHAGLIILIHRPSRLQERVALFRLLDKAGEDGIRNNINFA